VAANPRCHRCQILTPRRTTAEACHRYNPGGPLGGWWRSALLLSPPPLSFSRLDLGVALSPSPDVRQPSQQPYTMSSDLQALLGGGLPPLVVIGRRWSRGRWCSLGFWVPPRPSRLGCNAMWLGLSSPPQHCREGVDLNLVVGGAAVHAQSDVSRGIRCEGAVFW
jgi:hypothetical protein